MIPNKALPISQQNVNWKVWKDDWITKLEVAI